MPGMTANISINVAEHKNVLEVPSTALRFIPPQQYLKKMSGQLPDSAKRKSHRRNLNQGAGSGPEEFQNMQTRELTPGSFSWVWVLEGKQIKPVRVKIGLSNGTDSEVEGDLHVGENVVVGTLDQSASTRQNIPFAPGRRF